MLRCRVAIVKRLGVILAVASLCALALPAWAGGDRDVDLGAQVVTVETGKQPKATINKGKTSGLKVGSIGEIYPMRLGDGATTKTVDFDIRIATARVTAVAGDTATLALEAISDTIDPGAYFSTKISVSSELAHSTLFRVTALGIDLQPQYEANKFITVGDMLADPRESVRNKALDAMIADVKKMKEIVEQHLTNRIQDGEHHGKLAGQVVDELDRAQLSKFLLFVEAFPGKYIGHQWKLPEVYFTWVINGTPSGETERALRGLQPTFAAAKAATRSGDLDNARAHWKTVLNAVPDHKEATANIAAIDKILLLSRTVTDDPDDTATRYQLADALFDIGAFGLALKENQELRKRKYDPYKVERMRGYLLVRTAKWKEAAKLFNRLVKERPEAKALADWARYASAHARIEKNPDDPLPRLDLAAVNIDTESWDAALTQYRAVLSSKRATAKQRELAMRAQEHISIRKELSTRLEWARSDIRKHDLPAARNRIAQCLRLADKLGDADVPTAILKELAEIARSSQELDLALELLDRRVQLRPKDHAAHAELAYALLGSDQLAEAERAAKKSLEFSGDHDYAHLVLSYIASANDQFEEAERLAKLAFTNDPNYSWPILTLARAEASRGAWDDAIAYAKRALELNNANEMRVVHTAVMLGRQAHEALLADATSPRERLRLVRALAELGLPKRVAEEIDKLPTTGTWRDDAWWSMAMSGNNRVLLRDRLVAARNAKPSSVARRRGLALYEAREKLRINPNDDAARLALAKLYIKNEDFDLCLSTLGPLIKDPLSPEVGDLVRDARAGIESDKQLDLAWAALGRGDTKTAYALALQVQKVHDRIGTVNTRMRARELRANVCVAKGDYEKAIAIAQTARDIARAEGDPVLLSIANRQIANFQSNIGTNENLRVAVANSFKVCGDLDDDYCLFWLHLQSKHLEVDDGFAAKAIDHARKAWNLAERLGRPDLARQARFELANASLSANRLGEVDQLSIPLLADSRQAEDVTNEQYSLMLLGAAAMMRGNGEVARRRFQEVYDLGTKTGDTSWRALARRFEGLAWLQADHDAEKASIALAQANALYEGLQISATSTARDEVLLELADALLQAGKPSVARERAEEAYRLAKLYQRKTRLASAQWLLATIAIKENQVDDALTYAEQAVANASLTEQASVTWNAWHALARAHELKGNTKDAVAAYEKALEFVGRSLQAAGGESDRQGFMNTGRVRELYTNAIELFLKSGNSKRGMEVLELSRDAYLKQTFDPTKIQTTDPKLRERLDKYEQTRARQKGLEKQLELALDKPVAQRSQAQVKALGEQIAQSRQELNQVVLDLKVTHRHLFQALAMDPQNLVGRRDKLPKGSVLVAYFVADDALYAFVIAADLAQPAVVRVKVSSAELQQTVTEFRSALLAERDRIAQQDKVTALGRRLDDWLLQPLRQHIDGASTVIILPFGPLYYVPFDALVVSEPGAPLRYAVEDFRISIQTATTLEYLFAKPRPRSSGTMLAVANPDGSLPGANREVSKIVKTALPDAQVLGRNATVKKFRGMAGGFRYLHLATHGTLDPDPRKSFMKLSDGPLTVEMISQLEGLDQSNELVVLSACDTAVEKDSASGDELVSIAIAFSMAGSPALVASLWEVSDESTAELMATFYRALEQASGDRLDALRNAKLNVLRMTRNKATPYAAPWHWSSFQLYGDFRAPGTASP